MLIPAHNSKASSCMAEESVAGAQTASHSASTVRKLRGRDTGCHSATFLTPCTALDEIQARGWHPQWASLSISINATKIISGTYKGYNFFPSFLSSHGKISHCHHYLYFQMIYDIECLFMFVVHLLIFSRGSGCSSYCPFFILLSLLVLLR